MIAFKTIGRVIFLIAASLICAVPSFSQSVPTLSLGTGFQGDISHRLGLGLAEIVRRTSPGETSFAAQSKSSGQFNDFDLNIIGLHELSPASRLAAESVGNSATDLRIVGRLTTVGYGLFVRTDKQITEIFDLSDKRFPAPLSGDTSSGPSPTQIAMDVLLSAGGFDQGGITLVPISRNVDERLSALLEDKIDLLFVPMTSNTLGRIQAAGGAIELFSLPDTPEMTKALNEFFPGAIFGELENAPAFDSDDNPFRVIGVDYVLTANAETPQDSVGAILNALAEAESDGALASGIPDFADFTVRSMFNSYGQLGIDYHDAALNFLLQSPFQCADGDCACRGTNDCDSKCCESASILFK